MFPDTATISLLMNVTAANLGSVGAILLMIFGGMLMALFSLNGLHSSIAVVPAIDC